MKRIQKIFTLLQTSHLPEFENPRMSKTSNAIFTRFKFLICNPLVDASTRISHSQSFLPFINYMSENTKENENTNDDLLDDEYLFVSNFVEYNFSTSWKFKRSQGNNFIFHSWNNFFLISRNSRIARLLEETRNTSTGGYLPTSNSPFSVHSRFNSFPRKKKGEPKRLRFADRPKKIRFTKQNIAATRPEWNNEVDNEHGFQRYSWPTPFPLGRGGRSSSSVMDRSWWRVKSDRTSANSSREDV